MIDEFISGRFYKYLGPVNIRETGDWCPYMDFILDGRPHRCHSSENRFRDNKRYVGASFYDSTNPNLMFNWYDYLKYIYEVDLVTKDGDKIFSINNDRVFKPLQEYIFDPKLPSWTQRTFTYSDPLTPLLKDIQIPEELYLGSKKEEKKNTKT